MRLKRVITRHFPAKGYTAMTVWPWVFIRKDRAQYYTPTVGRHELTHACQQLECLWLPFFLLYVLEWAVKIPLCRFDTTRAYRSISFEQEAYHNQGRVCYNMARSHYAWIRYLFKLENR